MFTNADIRGVERAQCSSSGCDCDCFTRPTALDTCGVQAASVQCGWCCYCGHSPVSHCRIIDARSLAAEPEENNSIQLQSSPLISGAVQTSSPGNFSTPRSENRLGQEQGDVVRAAQCRMKLELGTAPEANSEPEPSPELELMPEPKPQPESSSKVSKKRRHDLEDDLTCSCGLEQKVKQLEQENNQLARQLEDARNISESLQLVRELKGLIRTVQGSNRIIDSSKVDIGSGVLVDKSQLDLLVREPNSACKFARRLLRMVFTTEELRGKTLYGKTYGVNKDTKPKEALDPVRLNAVIGYTCQHFNTFPGRLKNSLASMLSRDVK